MVRKQEAMKRKGDRRMRDFKYQMSIYNLFDYTGVERHLEKMAAKGWRFTSIGNFFWVWRIYKNHCSLYKLAWAAITNIGLAKKVCSGFCYILWKNPIELLANPIL